MVITTAEFAERWPALGMVVSGSFRRYQINSRFSRLIDDVAIRWRTDKDLVLWLEVLDPDEVTAAHAIALLEGDTYR